MSRRPPESLQDRSRELGRIAVAEIGGSCTHTRRSNGAEINNTINDGSFSSTSKLDCADGKSLNIGGSKNTLTVTGRCASVNIGGDENKVSFEKVDKELTIVGEKNTITYRDGDPQIQDLGSGNTITKG